MKFGRLLFLAYLAITGCSPERSFDTRGRVVGFGDDRKTVFITHEEIDGFMPAMTMPLRALDSREVERLEMGDEVSFELHVSADSSWITDIRPLPPDAPPLEIQDQQPVRRVPASPILEPGEQVPQVSLLDQDGDSLSLERFRGKQLLVNFIYTRCPLPEYCPLMTARFRSIQRALLQEDIHDVELLTVTVDPAFDRPAVLRAYADEHTSTLEQWTFATGNPDEVRKLASALWISYETLGDEVIHTLVTALVDSSGRLSHVWTGNRWTSDQVLGRISQNRIANTTGQAPR